MDEQRVDRDNEWMPELIDVPDICCVRVCDLPAVRVSVWPPEPKPGAPFELYATCAQHAHGGWD